MKKVPCKTDRKALREVKMLRELYLGEAKETKEEDKYEAALKIISKI